MLESCINNEAAHALPDVIAKELHYSSRSFCLSLAQWVAEQTARVNAAQTPAAARELRERFDEIESANEAIYEDYRQTHRRQRHADILQNAEELFAQYLAASWLRACAEYRIRELLFG